MSHTPAFRLASAAACATLALALVACGNANTQQETTQETPVVYDTSTNGNAATPAATTPAASTVDPNRDHDFAVDPNNRTEWRTTSDGTNTIWLTFDDGPSELTSQVLDTLDRYGVKATFFVTNISPAHANMIGEAYRRGHTIGLHTSSHDYAKVYASVDSYYADLDAIGETVREQIGYVPCFIRFPGGSSNAISASYTKGIMSTLVDDVQERGYQYFDWNVSCGDGAEGHDAQALADNSCDTEGYTNVMLLMHDSAPKQATVDALPKIIEHYQARGFTFKALDRNGFASHHGVNN